MKRRPPASRESPGSPDSRAVPDYTTVLHRAAKNVMRPVMRVTCPNCLTEYDVPDEAIAGRPRTVRCAHCGNQWRHGAPVDLPEQNPAPEAAPLIDVPPLLPAPPPPAVTRPPSFMPQPARPQTAPPPPPPRRKFGPAIIALLILALVIVVLAAHRPIMHQWPASKGFYNALGLG